MKISIRPHELAAAAVELHHCARNLQAAATEFAGRGADDIVDLGMKAIEASTRGLALTDHAIQVLAVDVGQLAAALHEIAAAYPAIDSSVVPQP